MHAGQQRHSYQKLQDTMHVVGNKFLVVDHPCSVLILSDMSDNINVLKVISIHNHEHLIVILCLSYSQH